MLVGGIILVTQSDGRRVCRWMRKPKGLDHAPATTDRIARAIGLLRGQKVLLDFDLAVLYGVETKALKRAVKRNLARFPGDFMFELTVERFENLRCQSGASRWGGRRYTISTPRRADELMLGG